MSLDLRIREALHRYISASLGSRALTISSSFNEYTFTKNFLEVELLIAALPQQIAYTKFSSTVVGGFSYIHHHLASQENEML